MTAAESAHPAFAHASEAELARILDFYEVRWRYEPDTYPIGWNLDGEVVESFSPDFYLPDMELYVELTTLKQKLVRKKNRKLRRLRELYPDIRIKLFYARDFRMLMLKFGRMALIEDLTGTSGQSTPPRPSVVVAPPSAGVGAAGAASPEPAGLAAPPDASLEPETPGGPGAGPGATRDGGEGADPGEPVALRDPSGGRGRRRGRRRRRPVRMTGTA